MAEGGKEPCPHPLTHTFKGQERSRRLGMVIPKGRVGDQESQHVRISMREAVANTPSLVSCLTAPPSVTDHPGLPPKVPHLWKSLCPKTQVWLVTLPTTHADESHHQGDPQRPLRVRGSLQL